MSSDFESAGAAIVLAAGFGTRLRPLTLDRPKALLDLGGRAVVEHVLERIRDAGSVERTILVTNARFEDSFRVWLRRWPGRRGADVRIVANEVTEVDDRPGAVVDLRTALEEVPGASGYVVVAADNVFGFSLDGLVEQFKVRREEGVGAVVAVEEPAPLDTLRGLSVACVDDDGWITRVQEKAAEPGCDRRVAAIYAFGRGLARWIERFLDDGGNPDSPGYLLEWLADTPRSGVRVAAHPVSGYRFDIGTPERYERARAFFEERRMT